MTVQIRYPHVEKVTGEAARLERLPRIRIAQIVMDYLAHDWTPDEMCQQHPYLSLAEAHAAMAYYYDYQAEIDDEIDHELNLVDQMSTKVARANQRNLRFRRRV